MEASKAEEIATSPDELQDLQDDQLIHQQTEPEPEKLRLGGDTLGADPTYLLHLPFRSHGGI